MRFLTCLLLSLSALSAQPAPRVTNAQLHTEPVSGSLDATIRTLTARSAGPLWIAYAVPTIPGDRQNCCWSSWDGGSYRGCSLEGTRVTGANGVTTPVPVRLEGPTHLLVLLRAERGQVMKIRSFSPDCDLDAGGLPFYQLTGVVPAQSVAWLAVWQRDRNDSDSSALNTIALHADPAADRILEAAAAPAQPDRLRRRALSLLVTTRGQRGFDLAARVIRDDPSDKVREQTLDVLASSRSDATLPLLLDLAKQSPSLAVRKKAVFWLSRSTDPRAKTFVDNLLK